LVVLSLLAIATPAGAQAPDDEPADTDLLCELGDAPDAGEPVGTTQRVEELEVTVTDTSFEPTIDDFWDEGYLRVEFELTNTGEDVYDYDGYHDWSLLDLEPGGTYPSTFDPTATNNAFAIGPGEGIEGHVVFPVGFNGGDYRVSFERDGFWDGGDQALWAVSIEPRPDPSPTETPEYVPTTEGFENLQAYDIDITINDDGSATFVETIEYDFASLRKHGIFRDLVLAQRCNEQYDRVYPMHDVSVDSPSGAPDQYTIEDLPDGKRIKIGDPDSTITGEHTYVVTYTLDGTLNGFPDHDELYWNVIGNRWGVPISNVDVTVHTPGDVDRVACFAGEYGSRAPCTRAAIAEGNGRFVQTYLGPFQSMSVVVSFPPGLVPPPEAILHERWSLARAFELTPATVGGTAALGALAIVGYGAMAYAIGRDRRAIGSATDIAFAADGVGETPVPLFEDESSPVEFIPPENIRPAQYGFLLHERVRGVDVSATIVDLAVRGYLRIEEIGEGRKRDYRFVRLRSDATGLLDYESKLFDSLVPATSGATLLSDHKDEFAGDLADIMERVYDDGQARKWFRHRPDKARARWRGIGFLIVLLTGGLLAVAIWKTHYALLVLPLVLFGLLVFFGAGKAPARTPIGTGLTRRSRGFEIFIRDSEAPRARWAEQNNIFSDYLPYAIVLGCADRWAKTFEPLGAAATAGAAAWYIGADPTRGFTSSDLATSTSSFASSAGSTLSSTPASSGSSGFSGGGGGGFSGGGGGGGGGGSW
jgi:uncharacterized membrane protein YgcG